MGAPKATGTGADSPIDAAERTGVGMIGRLVREPFVHLLAGGAILFAVIGGDTEEAPDEPLAASPLGRLAQVAQDTTIVVDDRLRSKLRRNFQSRFGRNPTDSDMAMLVARHIDDEVLFRAGLKRGLVVDDGVVRQRVIQKMRLALDAASGTAAPTDEAVAAFYSANTDRYTAPATTSFEHVFVGKSPTAESVEQLREQLTSGAIKPLKAGKPFAKGQRFRSHTAPKIDAAFGVGFAKALDDVKLDRWEGPLTSAYGQHLVRVTRRTPSKPQPLRTVRRRVLSDMQAQAAREGTTPLSKLRESFTIETR